MSAWLPDFLDAFERHRADGELLYNEKRWANADHMYGMAAECGLKAVMVGLGMAVDSTGVPQRPHKVHVDHLWILFSTFATTQGAAAYAAMLPTANPFDDWSVNDRYAHRTNFVQGRVDTHRQGFVQVDEIVITAVMDGRI